MPRCLDRDANVTLISHVRNEDTDIVADPDRLMSLRSQNQHAQNPFLVVVMASVQDHPNKHDQ